jgi:hypothetical protein
MPNDFGPAAGAGEHPPFERLSDLADGALGAAEREAVERHVAACAACRADLEALRGVLALAGAAPRAVEPPAEVWTGVRARLAPRTRAVRVRQLLWRRAPMLAAAAVLLVTVGLAAGSGGASGGLAFSDNALFRAVRESRPARAVRQLAAARSAASERAASRPTAGPAPSEDQLAMAAFSDTVLAAKRDSTLAARAHEPGASRFARNVIALLRLRSANGPNGEVVRLPSRAVVRQTYALDRAATELASTVRARQDALPPAARASLTRSLGVVDTAVAEARAALLRDPADPGIVDALAAAQERRVELLRQATRLLTED